MKSIALPAFAALALASCNKDQAADETSASGQNLAADSFGGNDVTAIDAATASDANMAEDVQLTVKDLGDLNSSDVEEPKASGKKTSEGPVADQEPAANQDASDNAAD